MSVFLDAPAKADWRELRRGPGFIHYHAATLPLVLHRKETTGYRVNLANGVPSVYVVLREDPTASDPVQVHLVSASPFEVQAYGESGMETVERVAMPERLVALVQAFVEAPRRGAVCQAPAPAFRRRGEQFGQEPIFVLRERLQAGARRAGRGGGDINE